MTSAPVFAAASSSAAVEVGLTLLVAGGDFADGVMSYEGAWLGGVTFVSFDKMAIALFKKQGQTMQLLS